MSSVGRPQELFAGSIRLLHAHHIEAHPKGCLGALGPEMWILGNLVQPALAMSQEVARESFALAKLATTNGMPILAAVFYLVAVSFVVFLIVHVAPPVFAALWKAAVIFFFVRAARLLASGLQRRSSWNELGIAMVYASLAARLLYNVM